MPLVAQDNVIDEVVWVVGDEAILKSEVEQERIRAQYEGRKFDGDPYCVIPEQLAVQKLFLHQAEIDSITVSDQDVLAEVEMRTNWFIDQMGSKEKMEEYYNKTSSQIREMLRETVRNSKLVQKMQQKIIGDVKLVPADVRRYFKNLPADSIPYVPTQVEVQIITVEPKIPQEEIERVKKTLRDYTERVESGEISFSLLARMYSEDPGSKRDVISDDATTSEELSVIFPSWFLLQEASIKDTDRRRINNLSKLFDFFIQAPFSSKYADNLRRARSRRMRYSRIFHKIRALDTANAVSTRVHRGYGPFLLHY